jgi:hypothetical protein
MVYAHSCQIALSIILLVCVQDKEDPTEEDLDAELAAAKQAATTKSGRLLARSFGFRSKKALQPAGAVAEEDEEAADDKAEPKTP